MHLKFISISLALLFSIPVLAQKNKIWNHKKCAVVLTYDDALNVHLDQVAPALDSLGLKGTFYVSGYSGALTNRIEGWRTLASKGHELGNHTLFHPCSGKPSGRTFVTPEYDLETYSVKRMVDEMKMTNSLLKAIDGKTKRTFAYPCGDTLAQGVPFYHQAKTEFVAARGVHSAMVKATNFRSANVGSFMINGQTGDQLIKMVKDAMASNAGIVFLFHGVGGEHSLNVSLQAHRQLLQYLKQHEKEIWITTFQEFAENALANKPTPLKQTRK